MEQIFAAFQYQVWSLLLWLIPWLLIATAVPALLLPLLKGRAGEAAVNRVLQRIADDVLHDVVLTSDDGTPTQIDHIARMPGGLLVVETKNFAGAILGTEREPRWRQSFGRGRGANFQNPLPRNKRRVLRPHSCRR